MGDCTITKREILVCIAITFILIGLGFLIITEIKNGINEKNEIYFKALKIKDNEEQFRYAIKTKIGYTLAQGKVQAINGVHIDDIEGVYFYINKVKEKYTMHTRQVEHTRTKSDGTTETYYTTEVYYTWDYAGEEEWHTERFNFLGIEINYGTINFYNKEYKDTIKINSDTRYKYYIIPFEFYGTLFTKIENNTINENYFYYNKEIESIIQEKESESDTANIVFWVIWSIFILIVDYGYVYLDNNYLED